MIVNQRESSIWKEASMEGTNAILRESAFEIVEVGFVGAFFEDQQTGESILGLEHVSNLLKWGNQQ